MIPGINLTYIDAVVIVALFISLIVGTAKGFVKQLFPLLQTIGVIVAAVLLAPMLGKALEGFVGGISTAPITSWLTGMETDSAIKLFSTQTDWAKATAEDISTVLMKIGIPQIFMGMIVPIVTPVFVGFGNVKLIDVLPATITSWISVGVAFILICIVLGIVLSIIKKATKKLVNNVSVIKGIDRLFGAVVGVGICYVLILAIFSGLTFLPATFLPEAQAAIANQIDTSIVTKFILSNNWLLGLLAKLFV